MRAIASRVAGQIRFDLRALRLRGRGLAHHLAPLDVQLALELGHALGLRGGVLDGVLDRRDAARAGVDLRANHFDVGFQPVDSRSRLRVLGAHRGQLRGGAVPGGFGFRCREPPRLQSEPGRFAARLELLDLTADRRAARLERLGLLPVEVELLLPDRYLQLTRVRVLAQRRRALLGRRQVQPRPGQIRLERRHARRRGAFTLARRRQPLARGLDGPRQLAIPAGEQHFLPSPQFFAQPPVAAGLGGLPLQRPALLLDLEHDVVDARQVLLRGLELQLGRAAAGLVLGDAGGFLDQLAAVGRPRAQDHPDLALLDDRVGLGAEPRVHQELVHVAQTAHLAVDQILAVAGSVETPGDFHVAREGAGELVEFGIHAARRRHGAAVEALGVHMPVAVAVPAGVAVAVGVGRRLARRRSRPGTGAGWA